MSKTSYKTGEICPEFGQYEIIEPFTTKRTGREVTVTKGEPFPPTQQRGQRYRLVDSTKHQSDETQLEQAIEGYLKKYPKFNKLF